jgi:hypothetical protein
MKSLKISEELHHNIKKYCADNSKNVQDIVEDKLSELVHKSFDIGTLQIINGGSLVTFQMELQSVTTMVELFKKLILNKALDNIDIITDLIKSIDNIENFIKSKEEQEKITLLHKKTVDEFFNSSNSHLNEIVKKLVDNDTNNDVNEDEDEDEDEDGVHIMGSNVNPNGETVNVNVNVKVVDDVVDENLTKTNLLSKESILNVVNRLGLTSEKDITDLMVKMEYDVKKIKKIYDVEIDETVYDIEEIIVKSKIALLKSGDKEMSVDAFSLFDKLNDTSENFDSNLYKIKSLYNVISLPQDLNAFRFCHPLTLDTCNWIYTLDNSKYPNSKIYKDNDYYVYFNDTNKTIDIISKDVKEYSQFVQPKLLVDFYHAIGYNK